MKRKKTIALMMIVMLLMGIPQGILASRQGEFGIQVPEQTRPYQPAAILLSLPQAGVVTLFARQGAEIKRLCEPMSLDSGVSEWIFWGLTALQEPLHKGAASIIARYEIQGKIFTAEANTQVLQPASGLMYALLSKASLPAAGTEDLYIDHQLSKAGKLVVQLYAKADEERPVRTWTLDRPDALPRTFRWDKTLAGKPASVGEYTFVLSVQGSSQPPCRLAFYLTDDIPARIPLSPTPDGQFLPQSRTDRDIWLAMMAPLAVLDIGDMNHQTVYAQPDNKSQALGMIHGQTAGMNILETDVQGYARVQVARHGDGQWIIGYVPQNKIKIIVPAQRYGLLLDKQSQHLTLYEDGEPRGSLAISTGVYVPPGEFSFETLAGAYLTQDRIAEFPHTGYRFEYAMRIDGGNLLHSSGYKMLDGVKDYQDHQSQLGTKVSHGCVRIDNREQDGINAWWLYANLPRNTKVLVLPEDGNEFLPGFASVQEAPPAETSPVDAIDAVSQDILQISEDHPETLSGFTFSPSPFLVQPEESDCLIPAETMEDPPHANQISPAAPSSATITLTFGGDCVLGSEEHTKNKPESFHSFIQAKGMNWPFSGIINILQADDLSMVNLENVLINSARNPERRLHNFRGPTSFTGILTRGSIELVNLANNHFNDYGQEGKNSTRNALRDEGIPFSGQSSIYIYEKDGIRIGFAGIRETVFHQGRERIAQEIRKLQDAGCHYIVYTCHFGTEYETQHNELQTLMAHTAIEAGAHLVIGHHPHVVQGIEEYRDGLIFYSLGNLVFGGNLALTTFDGLMVQLTLTFDQQALTQTEVRLIPVLTSSSIPDNDFRPVPAQGPDKERILQTIRQDSTTAYEEHFVILRKK